MAPAAALEEAFPLSKIGSRIPVEGTVAPLELVEEQERYPDPKSYYTEIGRVAQVEVSQERRENCQELMGGERIRVIETGDRPVFIFADLHFSPEFSRNSLERLQAVIKVMQENPNGIFIFNGDIIEAALCEEGGHKMMNEIRKHAGQPQADAFCELFRLLQKRYVVLTPGNHDLKSWYEKGCFHEEIADVFEDKVVIDVNGKRYLVMHGHQVARAIDMSLYEDMFELVRAPFLEIFGVEIFGNKPLGVPKLHYSERFEAWMVYLLGELYLRGYKNVNDHILSQVPTLKWLYALEKKAVIAELDGVIVGHTHLKCDDPENGFYVTPLPQHGEVGYIVIGGDGVVGFEGEYYDTLRASLDEFREKLQQIMTDENVGLRDVLECVFRNVRREAEKVGVLKAGIGKMDVMREKAGSLRRGVEDVTESGKILAEAGREVGKMLMGILRNNQKVA